MKRNINEHWNRASARFSNSWGGNRWSMLRKRGPQRSPQLDELQQKLAVPASATALETSRRGVQAPSGESAKLGGEALSVWEDDGGSTSLSMKPHSGKS